jgi:tetratricopeptide (TPR) repeat protein
MQLFQKIRRLLDWPQQAEAELAVLKSELAALKAVLAEQDRKLAVFFEEFDAQLACLRQPDDLRALQRLIQLRMRSGKDLPDDIHEKALRLQLAVNPRDPDLTHSLVALLHRQDRPPVPDAPAGGPGLPGDDLDALVRSADAHARADDLFRVYAALWQVCVRHPDDARGWAEYARFFAERYEWQNCRLAAGRAFAVPGACSPAAADALFAALSALAENGRLGDLDWKPWFERLPEPLRVSAHAIRLLVALGDPRAASLVPPLLRDKPESFATWLAASMVAFEQDRPSDSYEYLRRALAADPAATLHTVVRDWSMPASTVLEAVGKTDELATWLSQRHAENPGLNLVPLRPAPEAALAVRRQRRQALDRGLPPFLFVPLYKSASATLNNIIAAGFDLPTVLYSLIHLRVIPPWLQDFMQGGASYSTHLFPFPVNIELLAAAGVKKVIVHVRDPRQVIISGLEHGRRYSRELSPTARNRFLLDPHERLNIAIEQDLPAAVAWIEGWLAARGRLNVHVTTFEEFIRDRNAFVDRLIALYGGDTRYFNRDVAFRGSPATDLHFRRGEIDEWRRLLDARQTDRVNALIPDNFWSTFGWSP